MTFSLINTPWIPVVDIDGNRSILRPADIAEAGDVTFAWGRPDLNVATFELLIGLLAVAFPANTDADWHERLQNSPSSDALHEAFQSLMPWFNLDGDGPRFMQDFEDFESDEVVTDALFIDAPGANALRNGTELFVKGERSPNLSRPAAAIALYALQAFAPSGGAGHRTSMRGGGPFTTLLWGDLRNSDFGGTTLWRRIWTNVVPSDHTVAQTLDVGAQSNAAKIFPWCSPTHTSEGNRSCHVAEAHPLQAFFGMPRRIRLQFESGDATFCPITGETTDKLVTGFRMKPYGVNYHETWRHPLSPYYRPKKGKTDLPLHPKSSRYGYRDWVGLIYALAGSDSSSQAIIRAENVAKFANYKFNCPAVVYATGYVMDNMKALDFLEAEFPLIVASNADMQEKLEGLAHSLVAASEHVMKSLRPALQSALGANAKASVIAGPIDSFWADTEQPFRDALRTYAGTPLTSEEPPSTETIKKDWLKRLTREAFKSFDTAVPPTTLLHKRIDEQKNIIDARAKLKRNLGVNNKFFRKAIGPA